MGHGDQLALYGILRSRGCKMWRVYVPCRAETMVLNVVTWAWPRSLVAATLTSPLIVFDYRFPPTSPFSHDFAFFGRRLLRRFVTIFGFRFFSISRPNSNTFGVQRGRCPRSLVIRHVVGMYADLFCRVFVCPVTCVFCFLDYAI